VDAATVKAFFDDVASDWDTMRLSYYDERVIEQLADRTRLHRAQTVVDAWSFTTPRTRRPCWPRWRA
jgi:hypothetical protein